MKQTVTIIAAADRHSEDHNRDFARAYEIEVEAGYLNDVLHEATAGLALPRGAYTINIDWPHE